ncbi:GDP-mannose 4,6-dehydratase [candidate division WOR-3 bacterium JGI_Cruoil_03_44_89]|uniref:GDP-mannose 4,6-dehydratase n=1 Tax=candidate division WOR-3 bacterium JGI_Cruoil_03_44_89 TaxID=1973748 RepID=A0A235BRH4_UNCW3|nr:MAG: GDP-mannose 4,6-dehydratase [candidate division WOR-3 bacterium JGI_Cruoil_03_44_89]
MTRVLITGITGFAGSHLADYLLEKTDLKIYGIKRWRSRTENIEHLMGKIEFYECDLRDASSVRDLIEVVRPDMIFHLAAQSFVPTSWSAPAESLETNIMGELNLFEAVKRTGIDPLIQIAGSSEEYGAVEEDEIPIKETTPLRPLSPYAVSKVGQDMLAYQYFKSYGMRIVRTRGFNHTGPRRPPVFVCSDFAKQIADIERGVKHPIVEVGNLKAVRDFTDVRDMVRGYWLALARGTPGEVYNICSGVGRRIGDVLSTLISIGNVEVDIEVDKRKLRPSDVPRLIGDSTKLKTATGWQPTIPFEETLENILNFWRESN